MNQCDGCLAGYPVDENNNHRVPYPSGWIRCTKDRYQPTSGPLIRAPAPTDYRNAGGEDEDRG